MDLTSVASNKLDLMGSLKVKETDSQKPNVIETFSDVFKKALFQVNDLELQSDVMVQKMITEPQKVDIHDVTTLLSQSEMALGLTKAVTDRVINAYREITNLR